MSAVVHVAGQTMELAPPRRASTRMAIQIAAGECGGRGQLATLVLAAALFACWTNNEGKKGLPVWRYDVLAYGAAVMDYLTEQGAYDEKALVDAGNVALKMVLESLPTDQQLEEARGNSAARSG